MKRQRTTIPIPWSVKRITIAEGRIGIFTTDDVLTLTLRDKAHLEDFLSAFSEAWMRWKQKGVEVDPLLDDLQHPLPF